MNKKGFYFFPTLLSFIFILFVSISLAVSLGQREYPGGEKGGVSGTDIPPTEKTGKSIGTTVAFPDGTVLNKQKNSIKIPGSTLLIEGDHRKDGEYSKRGENTYLLPGGIVLLATNKTVTFPNGFKLVSDKEIVGRDEETIQCEVQPNGTVKLIDKGYEGSILRRDGLIRYKNGLVESRDGSIRYQNGYKLILGKRAVRLPEGLFILGVKTKTDGSVEFPNGFVLKTDGSLKLTDGYKLDKDGELLEVSGGKNEESIGVLADLSKRIKKRDNALIFPVCTVRLSDKLIQERVKVTLDTISGEMSIKQKGLFAGLGFTEKAVVFVVVIIVLILIAIMLIDRLEKGGASIYQHRKDIFAVIKDFRESLEKNSSEISDIKEKLKKRGISFESQMEEEGREGITAGDSRLLKKRDDR